MVEFEQGKETMNQEPRRRTRARWRRI